LEIFGFGGLLILWCGFGRKQFFIRSFSLDEKEPKNQANPMAGRTGPHGIADWRAHAQLRRTVGDKFKVQNADG